MKIALIKKIMTGLCALIIFQTYPAARQEPSGEDTNDAVEEYIDHDVNNNNPLIKRAVAKQKRKRVQQYPQKISRPSGQKKTNSKKNKRAVRKNIPLRPQQAIISPVRPQTSTLQELIARREKLKNRHAADAKKTSIYIPQTPAFMSNQVSLHLLRELYRKEVYGSEYAQYKQLSFAIESKKDQLYAQQVALLRKKGFKNIADQLLNVRKEEKEIKQSIIHTPLITTPYVLEPGKSYSLAHIKKIINQSKDKTAYTGKHIMTIQKVLGQKRALGIKKTAPISLDAAYTYLKQNLLRQKAVLITEIRQAKM